MTSKTLLTSFVFASLCLGCSQAEDHSKTQSLAAPQTQKTIDTQLSTTIDPQLQQWVGSYRGIVPCNTCLSYCDGCEGNKIELTIHPDQSFELVKTNLNGENQPESFKGHFSFSDDQKLKIQLSEVKERNILILGNDFTEIIDTKTNLPFQQATDFQLDKIA